MTNAGDPAPIFELETVGVRAKGQPRGEQFVVLAGSQARVQVTDSYERYVPASYREHRQRLIDEGVLQVDTDTGELRFTRDELFNGSMEAGCVVAGRMVNGIREWFVRAVDGTKQTHEQWLTWFWGNKDTPIFTLKTDRLTAYAQMRKGRFVVLAGSEAVKSMDSEQRQLKQQLLDSDILREKPDSHLLEFTADTPFESATAASSVILLRVLAT